MENLQGSTSKGVQRASKSDELDIMTNSVKICLTMSPGCNEAASPGTTDFMTFLLSCFFKVSNALVDLPLLFCTADLLNDKY